MLKQLLLNYVIEQPKLSMRMKDPNKIEIGLSILTILSIGALVLYFVIDFFKRSKAIIIFNQSNDYEHKINLTSSPLIFRI
jgi:hypothetical protein